VVPAFPRCARPKADDRRVVTLLERSTRRLDVGAEVVGDGVDIRVWAPGHERVEVLFEDDGASPTVALERESDGTHHSAFIPGIRAGACYRLRVDGGEPIPDPTSRFLPDGPHGASEIVDPTSFPWTDAGWRGPTDAPNAIYELHVGSFTRDGTFDAARAHLSDLAALGIEVVEFLPLADFSGRFGWGYGGVDPFAPSRLYGRPDDLRRFVDDAHRQGIGVILDVVYNHLRPDGCYVTALSDTFFSRRHSSEWGETLNFDADGSDGVREFVLANVQHWIEEYHLDGLRLDAAQQIFDTSPEHILAAIARTARESAKNRRILLVVENEPQETRLVRPLDRGGYGIDALWNDDLHHSATVALTGRREAYYSDYFGNPQEFVSAARHGYHFQGQRYDWQGKRRGSPALDLPPTAFVNYLQNHDQVANSGRGERISALASPGRLRAVIAYLLLAPQIPMLFMGQEWAASAPFLFFADHGPDLAPKVFDGRRDFLTQFPSLTVPSAMAAVADPSDPATFEQCRLHHAEADQPGHVEWLTLHRDLLALRRSTPVFARSRRGGVDGAVLGESAFVLRYFDDDDARGASAGERLLIVNLGPRLEVHPAPEPLLAPPAGAAWRLVIATDDARYGGIGTPEPESGEGWSLPAESAVVLRPVPRATAQ
jgi:maltooligosyltrehalose trehalohydrolase